MPDFNFFVSRGMLDQALAAHLARLLYTAIRWRGVATAIISGGRTPVGLFERLSGFDLPWAAVTLVLADERWVDENDDRSNARLVRRHLLRGPASAARLLGLKTDAADPTAAVESLCEHLAAPLAQADVVVLGMGEDGHTASLIPGASGLAEALASERHVAALYPPPPQPPRISLTPRALLAGRRIVLHLTGAGKRTTLERALATGPAQSLPVRTVLHQDHVPCEIWWAP